MAVIQTNLTCELQEPVKVRYLDGNLFSQDNQANQINVAVVDGGEPATISGTVTADVIRSDGGTVAVSGGTISGNVASISLPSAAYAVPGVVSIVMKLTTSGVITTIAAIVANVYKSSTETAIDPGTIIPSVTALISAIETAVASIPADYSSLWTSLAPAFSSSTAYVAGQYVTYNGGLYRFNTAHTGSWASGDVSAVNIGGELSSLKSAFNYSDDIRIGTFSRRYENFEQGTIDSSGNNVDNSSWVRTAEFIPIDQLLLEDKPVGIQRGFFFYDSTKTFIESASSSQNTASYQEYYKVRADHPTAKYFKMRLRMYNGSTALTTTPDMIKASDLNIIVVKTISDGYFEWKEQTLTESESIVLPYNFNSRKNMILEIRAKYTGTQPTIQAVRSWIGSDNKLHQYYNSALFPIGGGQYVTQRIRIAPSPITSDSTSINIAVPEGTTLNILYLRNTYSDEHFTGNFGINLNGHGGYGCGCPRNTAAGYEMAAKMGYKYCVTIPKVTSDGVLVCLHDDDSIQSTARNDDGTQIADEYKDHPVSWFTYSQLLQFDFGISRGIPYKGERIPKLERFFEICAKTGMHPMLSCHPSLYGYWNDIKALAIKYNLLDKLNIKCDYDNITIMMDALGGDIESYTIDESGGVDRAERMATLVERYNIDTKKCRCGVEYITTITDALISSALANGLFVGFYGYGTDAATVKTLIGKGVTEFTDDYIASVGLDW